MKYTDIPAKFQIPFGADADAPYIRPVPVNSQVGIQDGAASLETGFPPDTFNAQAAGGSNIWGADMNGILNQISAWSRWLAAGAPTKYDATYQALIGGYPQGAYLEKLTVLGEWWLSLNDDNTTNPETGGAGWRSIPVPVTSAQIATGAAPLTPSYAQPSDNLILANDATFPTRDINISPGACRSINNHINLQLAGIMDKRMDQAWAPGGVVGSPVGCLDAGSTKQANKTYHIYLIGRIGLTPTTRARTSNVATLHISSHGLGVGTTVRVIGLGYGYDGLFPITGATTNTIQFACPGSDEATTDVVGGTVDGFDILGSQQDINNYPNPSMPAGWTEWQSLGSILTDGSSNVLAFNQLGDEFLLAVEGSISSGTPTVGSTASLWQGLSPIGVKTIMRIRAVQSSLDGSDHAVMISSPDQSDESPVSPTAYNFRGQDNQRTAGEYLIRTNTAGQVRLRANPGGITLLMAACGWFDPRRRLF